MQEYFILAQLFWLRVQTWTLLLAFTKLVNDRRRHLKSFNHT